MRRYLWAISIAACSAMMPAQSLAAKPAPAEATGVKAKSTWVVPRTVDGQPDLQGVWSNASNIPLERPKALGSKEFYTPEELAALRAVKTGRSPDIAPIPEAHYDLSQFGLDNKWVKVAPNLRTSLIAGPEGRVPPYTPEAAQRVAARAVYRREHLYDSAQDRSLSERCIMWGNEGAPMLPQGYNSNLQIFQSAHTVAILQEMIHDVRIIPLDNRPHLAAGVEQWAGDSRGHFEGNTLVVDTTNFNREKEFRGSTDRLHVTERFTRTGPDALVYQFTVEDPATWTKPWSGEVPMVHANGRIYEYACHEGNLGMPDILSGARAEEKKAAEKMEEAKKRAAEAGQ